MLPRGRWNSCVTTRPADLPIAVTADGDVSAEPRTSLASAPEQHARQPGWRHGRRGRQAIGGLAAGEPNARAAGVVRRGPQVDPEHIEATVDVNGTTRGAGAAGLLLGLWHGLIVPVTFVISPFTDTVNIYDFRNSGNWYDVGFFLGIVGVLGGGGSGARLRGGR